jgi:sugar O-acyltransferase (sialic acid O-acetyltransferase NeuD family)
MNDGEKLPVVVIGWGGHGRVVADALLAAGRRVLAATDLKPPSNYDAAFGLELITDEDLVRRWRPDEVELALGVGSVWPTDETSMRWRAVERFKGANYRFTGVHHPAAWISPRATIMPTAQVHAGAIVQNGAVIGEHCIVNTHASVDHDGRIEDYCHIAPGAVLSGNVRVGWGSHLGTACSVTHCVSIGAKVLVAAGATVVANVPDGVCVRGTPAKSFQPSTR